MSVAIVTLTGYPDIFAHFRTSAETYEPGAPKIAVLSNGMDWAGIECLRKHPAWHLCGDDDAEKFSFPRNANIGIRAAAPHDVFLVNDDVSFLRHGTLADLERIAYSDPSIGILSPQFFGTVGNPLQMKSAHLTGLTYSTERLCFTGVYLKRSVLDRIGELDERFSGYGCDDDDYCRRLQEKCLWLAVTPEVVLKHGYGNAHSTSSFFRSLGAGVLTSAEKMREIYLQKWGRPVGV
jgi:GT2 family glycosyltransferase